MSENFKPGTVANATVRGVPNVRVFRRTMSWITGEAVEGAAVQHDHRVTDVRPLVVIDPEDDQDVKRLCDAYRSVDHGVGTMPMQRALRELIAPKPAEPTGRYAVVEDRDCLAWVLADPGTVPTPWKCLTLDRWANYADINVVRVLSEGVEE